MIKTFATNLVRFLVLSSLALFAFSSSAAAAPVTRSAWATNAALLQPTVDQFRTDLGGANNGNGNSFTTGRREINWDGAGDAVSSPNNLAFNAFAGRGAIFNSIANLAGDNPFILSARASSGVAVRYGDIDPSYTATFQAFSQERLFVARGSNIIEIRFVIPGTQIPATVSGFGAIFTDVDNNNNTFMEVYDAAGKQLAEGQPPSADGGLSFLGISFNAGERIAKVILRLGNAPLAPGNVDGQNGVDVVATDDFIYGEPRALEQHPSDFDGDGTSDFAVFRPSAGAWFILNSGSNTFQAVNWGTNGDIPVDGDFDGDRRSDFAVFRPSLATWFVLRSSNNQFVAQQFGTNGDKPTPGDYDKDGITDIAVWRPSSGNYFFSRSSNGQFSAFQWGTTGDIPIQSAPVP